MDKATPTQPPLILLLVLTASTSNKDKVFKARTPCKGDGGKEKRATKIPLPDSNINLSGKTRRAFINNVRLKEFFSGHESDCTHEPSNITTVATVPITSTFTCLPNQLLREICQTINVGPELQRIHFKTVPSLGFISKLQWV